MKRPLLLSLTGITTLALMFLSVPHAAAQLRDIPQTGGNFPQKLTPLDDSHVAVSSSDSTGILRGPLEDNVYTESFYSTGYMDADNTTASWGGRRLALPPARLQLRREYLLSAPPTDVAVAGDYVYVAVAGGFVVYHIGDPDNAMLVGSYALHSTVSGAQAVAILVSGATAYISAGPGGLEVVDVSDPTHPAYVNRYLSESGSQIKDAVANGTYLYLVDSNVGVITLDVSTPQSPVPIGTTTLAGMTDIDRDGDLVMTAGSDRIATLFVGTPHQPALLDTHNLPGVRRILVHGAMAYASVNRAFGGIDVSLPTTIRQTSSSSICDGGGLVFEDHLGGRLYLADGSCGVRVMDVQYAENVSTYGWIDLDTNPRKLALTDEYLVVVGTNPSHMVIMDRLNSLYDTEEAVATSKTVYAYHYDITDVRIDTEQIGTIDWEVSADGGAHWQAIEPGGAWNRVQYPGTDLRWRAFLRVNDDTVPRCTRLTLASKTAPEPPPVGGVILVRPDGSGHVTNLHAARDLARPNDTLLLGDGVFTGPENRGLYFDYSITIRSENGPDHTIIDCQDDGPVFTFQGNDYNFHLCTVEGIRFKNARPPSNQGTINGNRCFVIVDNCEFIGGDNTAIFTDLAFVDVRASRFIDCDNGIAAQFNLEVSDCLFQGLNIGVWFANGGARVSGSTFFDNRVAIDVNYDGGVEIENNTISYNHTGVWLEWANGSIRNNIIDSNGVGIWFEESQGFPVEGNLIVHNTDAAIAIEGSDVDIVGNTFCDNDVRRLALIDIRDFSGVTATRNIFAFNNSGDLFGSFENTRAVLTANDFFDNYGDPLLGTIDGGDNTFDDPRFCNRTAGEYTLRADSPCLPGNNPLHQQIGARGVGCSTRDDATIDTPVHAGLISVAPNPFNPATHIRYGLTEPGRVRLVIYDVAGRVVARLIDNNQDEGEREIQWNASTISSGVYFARLSTPDGTFTRKLVVMK